MNLVIAFRTGRCRFILEIAFHFGDRFGTYGPPYVKGVISTLQVVFQFCSLSLMCCLVSTEQFLKMDTDCVIMVAGRKSEGPTIPTRLEFTDPWILGSFPFYGTTVKVLQYLQPKWYTLHITLSNYVH